MTVRAWSGWLYLILLGAGAPALGQVGPQEVHPRRSPAGPGQPPALRLLAGVQGFSGGLSAGTGAGPFIGVVGELQPWFLLGVELAYEAARLPVEERRAPGDAALWSHTGLVLLKLGLPVSEELRPFFATGAGVATIQPTRAASETYAQDVLMELPLVLGVDARLGPFSAGLRVSYRSVWGDDFDRAEPRDPSGGLLSASVELGGRF